MRNIAKLLLFFSFFGIGCRKNYNPPVVAANANYLVVEGLINTGSDSTIITLSRTVNIKSKVVANPELGAVVTVESSQNGSYPLQADGKGNYFYPGLNLNNTLQYRLRIHTADGKTYLSDFVVAKVSPPIDSVGFNIQANGAQIYLNTHDPSNNTRYYRWQYTETWMFHVPYDSYFIYQNSKLVFRTQADDIYECWRRDTTSTLVLNSTAKLSQDVVYQTPMTFVASTSEKLEDRYSILVVQYALTPEAYDYYTLLKKNTEQLGSIFDAQPSQPASNIHNVTDPNVPVIGYISAGTATQKRIYIDSRQLPAWTPVTYYDTIGCAGITVQPQDYPYDYGGTPPKFIATVLPSAGEPTICVDCTLRGTRTQPSFWTY